MGAHQTIATAALAAKSSVNTPKNARWEARSETMRREISLESVVVIILRSRAMVRSQSAKISSRLCSAHPAETLGQLLCEKSRLLEGGEVVALL
jgi:hypothetical protein